MQRLIGRSVPMPAAGARPATMRPIEADDWPHVIAYDAAVFGADRGGLLQRLAPALHDAALIAERDGQIAGYLLGRDGRVMNQLGPLAAEDDVVAIDLLARAIGSISTTASHRLARPAPNATSLACLARLCSGAAVDANGLRYERSV